MNCCVRERFNNVGEKLYSILVDKIVGDIILKITFFMDFHQPVSVQTGRIGKNNKAKK